MTRAAAWGLTAALTLVFSCDSGGGDIGATGELAAEPAGPCSAGCPGAGRMIALLSEMAFAVEAPPGISAGLDLDGVVSLGVGGDASGCGHADFTGADGTPGVDNQLALLVPVLELEGGQAVHGLIQNAILDGGLLVVIELTQVDDPRDDDAVELAFWRGDGVPLKGTDGRVLASQTMALRDDPPLGLAEGSIRGGVLEAGPFTMDLPVTVFGIVYTLRLNEARLRVALGEDATMTAGIIGGGVDVGEVEALVGDLEGAGNVPDLIAPVFAELADLAPDESGTCQRMSANVTFGAVPAFIHGEEPPAR